MRRSVPLVVALLLLAAAPAARADVTIGDPLIDPPDAVFQCGDPRCTIAPTETILPRTAPSAGVLTRWRISVGSQTEPIRLRVIARPGTAQTDPATSLASTDLVTPVVGMVNLYRARIPVPAGAQIAIDCCPLTGLGVFFRNVPNTGGVQGWFPTLVDGQPGTPFVAANDVRLLLNADIEPDADADGFGDETQDDCPGVAGSADGCVPPAPPPAPRVNAPPTVRFVTPVAATTVGSAQAIDLEVSDDAGSPRVTVHDDDGTICTLTAAPYSCIWTPTGADVGRATLLASATDSDGRTTLGIVRVTVPRFAATLTRRRSGRRVTGRLRLPAAVEPALGCRGTVTVRRGKAKRAAALKPNCTYAVRLPRKASGAVKARFGGNPVVLPT